MSSKASTICHNAETQDVKLKLVNRRLSNDTKPKLKCLCAKNTKKENVLSRIKVWSTNKFNFQAIWTLFSSFLLHNIVFGLAWTNGIWIQVFLDEFKETVAKTALVGSVQNGMVFIFAFVGSLFISK